MEIPVRQFIEYLSQDEMVFYHGSLSVPACDETVSWFVNTTPHVITAEQVQELKALLGSDVNSHGGNYRDIQPLNDRKVYRFNNYANQHFDPMSALQLDSGILSSVVIGCALASLVLFQSI